MNLSKKIFVGLLLLLGYFGYSQDKKPSRWFSTASIDFSVPHQMEYFYGYSVPENHNGYLGGNTTLKGYGVAFGTLYTINYLLFKRLSIGPITGFQFQVNPNYFMCKLGGRLTYFLVDKNNLYTYVQINNNFSLDKTQFSTGGHFRLGAGIPIAKIDNVNMDLEVFFEQNSFRLEGANSLLTDEIPESIAFKSYGISLGIKF